MQNIEGRKHGSSKKYMDVGLDLEEKQKIVRSHNRSKSYKDEAERLLQIQKVRKEKQKMMEKHRKVLDEAEKDTQQYLKDRARKCQLLAEKEEKLNDIHKV